MMNDFKGVARGVTPINTGKVLIGRDYIPRRPQYTTEAELFWQGVLLSKRQPTSVRLFSTRLRSVVRALTFWRVK